MTVMLITRYETSAS